MKKINFNCTLLFAIFFIWQFKFYSQVNKADSLFTVLKNTGEDTVGVNTLNLIVAEIKNSKPDTALYLAKQALSLAEKIKFTQGQANSELACGTVLLKLNKHEEALTHLNLALGLSKRKKINAQIYHTIANVFSAKKDYQAALEMQLTGLKILKELGDKKGIAGAYHNIGMIYSVQGNFDEALKHYLIALKINEEIGNKAWASNNYYNMALLYRTRDNNQEALKNYSSGLELRKEIGDKLGCSMIYNNIGSVYMDVGNYPEALKNYLAALKIREDENDKPGIISTYNNIGNVYSDLKNYPLARKNYLVSLKMSESMGDKRYMASLTNNLGIVYEAEGNHSEALKSYSAALEINKETGNKQWEANNHMNMGAVYKNLNDFSRALEHYLFGLKIYEEKDDQRLVGTSFGEIGSLYLAEGKFKEADLYLKKARTISQKVGDIEGLAHWYKGLSELADTMGRSKEGLRYFKQYIIYRDSMFNSSNSKKIVQQQMQYDFDKKESLLKAEQEKKDAVATQEKHKQSIILFSVMGSLSVVIVFSFFLYRRFKLTQKQKHIIEQQKALVEESQKEILDSIRYAKRIQTSFLPTEKYIARQLGSISRVKSGD